MDRNTGGELPCPLCGEPLKPEASKCKSCGASIPRQTKDSLATLMKVLSIDAKKAQRLYNLGYRRPEDLKGKNIEDVLKEEPKIFLCPECGAFVHEKEEKCSRCGAEFGSEAMEIEEYLVREERPCPHCGELIHIDAQTCPSCGKPVVEPKGVSLGSTYMCPSCGVTVLEGQESCEVCGTALTPAALIASKALEIGAVACPKCGGTIDSETGVCPYCSKTEAATVEDTEEQTEVIDEIDRFLEHLTALPTTKGAVRPKVAPVTKRTVTKRPVAKRGMPPKAERPGAALEIRVPKKTELPSVSEEHTEGAGEEKEVETPARETTLEEDLLPELMKLLEEERPPQAERPIETEATLEEGQSKEIEEIMEFEQPMMAEGEAEAEVEAALEGLDADLKQLPKVKLLKPSYSKMVRAPATPRATPESPRLQLVSEIMLYATAVGLSLQLFVARAGIPTLEWAFFVLFGLACGLSTGMVALSIKDLRKTIIRAWQPLLGTVLTLIVPAHWFAGLPAPEYLDAVLVLAGLALWVPSFVRIRGRAAWLGVWVGGSLTATVMASASALMIDMGGGLSSAMVWINSAVLVLAGVVLSIETRWLRRGIDLSLQRGEEEFRRREFRQSIEDYDRAIEMARRSGEEDIATPWYSKGAALVVMGRYEEALKAIDEALRINPNNEVAWVNKGNALSRMGDITGALKAFNAALRANPRYEVAWNNKGNALARLGRFREGLKCYDLALQIDSSYRGAWINKGFVLAKIGEYEEAAKCAETVMALGGYVTA